MSVEQDREFLSRVVPWPAAGEPGYINIHWRRPGLTDPKKLWWSGKPTTNVNEFFGHVSWGLAQDSVKDIFFCLSRQAICGKTKNGYPSPIRNAEGAMLVKALWADVDVKEPPKGYADMGEAIDAVIAFCHAYSLPNPSAMVASGSGGLHVYWISDRPMTVDLWRPYAEGLKTAMLQHGLRADVGCTTDVARVLRVPNTLNYKNDPPRPTALLGLGPDYDFENTLSLLTTLPRAVTDAPSVTANNAAPRFDLGTPHPAFSSLKNSDSLADGLERESLPLAWEPVARQCAFVRDAILTGGKDYTQPMWNLTTLAATFLEDGNALAHKMGNKHPGYDSASTEALWDRKQRERKDRGLGWPSCRSVQATGCTACGNCPHFNAGKSPLNLTTPAKPAGPVTQAQAAQTITAAVTTGIVMPTLVPPKLKFMPLTGMFVVNRDGYICKQTTERAE